MIHFFNSFKKHSLESYSLFKNPAGNGDKDDEQRTGNRCLGRPVELWARAVGVTPDWHPGRLGVAKVLVGVAINAADLVDRVVLEVALLGEDLSDFYQ